MTGLRSLAFNVLFFAWTAVIAVCCLPLLVLPRRTLYWASRTWARVNLAMLAGLCGLRYELRGLDNIPAGPCIVASKHQSAWDTMIFPILFDAPCYVVKRELVWIPLFGLCLVRYGNIPIDRSGGAKALRALIRAARDRLNEGRSIVIFPEGTRVAPGLRRPHHPGTAALYMQLDVPVVPVAVNSGLFWGRRTFVKKPGRIVLEVLPPIPPGLPRKAFAATLEERIETASARLLAPPAGEAAARGEGLATG